MKLVPGQTRRNQVWLPVLLILIGVWIRVPLLWMERPFQVDEALYATFAREISHQNNPLLINLPVDKPPLVFYFTALSFKLFTDPSEWAACLPNLYASVLSLAVLWKLALRLYRDWRVAALAGLFLALSPSDATFAATAFTDPLATLFILLACLGAASMRWGLAGLCVGLAFACKQSAVQFVPLIVGIGSVTAGTRHLLSLRNILRFAVPSLLIITLTFAWGAARMPGSSDWWALGAANNAPNRLIRSDEVGPRLEQWLNYLSEGIGGPSLLIVILAVGPILLLDEILRRPRQRETAVDVLLTAYVIGTLLVYWLAAFNVYDRYLHTIIPLIGLLLGRILLDLPRLFPAKLRARALPVLMGIVIIAVGPGALLARNGNTPLRDEIAPYQGIADVAAALNSLPPGTIVYDHWLGWQLWWYTGQHRPRDMWLRITYYPTPEALAQDAAEQPDPMPRYFVAPEWVRTEPWLDALDEAGFDPQVEANWDNFILYRLTPP